MATPGPADPEGWEFLAAGPVGCPLIMVTIEQNKEQLDRIEKKVDAIQTVVDRTDRAVYGDQPNDQPGLVQRMRILEAEVRVLQQTQRDWKQWAAGFLAFGTGWATIQFFLQTVIGPLLK